LDISFRGIVTKKWFSFKVGQKKNQINNAAPIARLNQLPPS
jgi:hypothetical protein